MATLRLAPSRLTGSLTRRDGTWEIPLPGNDIVPLTEGFTLPHSLLCPEMFVPPGAAAVVLAEQVLRVVAGDL